MDFIFYVLKYIIWTSTLCSWHGSHWCYSIKAEDKPQKTQENNYPAPDGTWNDLYFLGMMFEKSEFFHCSLENLQSENTLKQTY